MSDNFYLTGKLIYDPQIQSRIVKQETTEDGSETFTDVDTDAIIEKYQIIDPTQVPYPSTEEANNAPLPSAEEYAKWRAGFEESVKELEEWVITAPVDEQDYLLQATEIRRRRSPGTAQKLTELTKLYILQTDKQEILTRITQLHSKEIELIETALNHLPKINHEESKKLINEITDKQQEVRTKFKALINLYTKQDE